MFKDNRKRYIQAGITLFIVVAASILLTMMLSRLDTFRVWIGGIFAVFSPLAWGIALAYILNPVETKAERLLFSLLKKRMKEKTARSFAHGLGVLIAMLVALLSIFGIIMLIVPQLWESVTNLVANGRTYYSVVEGWVNDLFASNDQVHDYAENLLESSFDNLETWFTTKILPSAQSVMTAVATGVYSVIRKILTFLVGLIMAAYLLAGKKRYIAQLRKLTVALFTPKAANRIQEISHHANRVFGGFIRGKILDSCIIGILCYLGAMVLDLPYAILVATVVGVTNVIPFFGPLIGAVPCAFIILLVSPIKCLYFIIFVLLLQQLDGNIIGPRILGDTTGLSSFWVLVAITVFSGLFGFAGMLLGVPVFAVLYILVKEILEQRLQSKGLPVSTLDYFEKRKPAAEEPAPEQKEEQK